jgi:hypothetical protein
MIAKQTTNRRTEGSLKLLIGAACRTDSRGALMSSPGNGCRSTMFIVIPVALTVLKTAAELEPDPAKALVWYRTVQIRELDNLTAANLVQLGRAESVINFLSSIRSGLRG